MRTNSQSTTKLTKKYTNTTHQSQAASSHISIVKELSTQYAIKSLNHLLNNKLKIFQFLSLHKLKQGVDSQKRKMEGVKYLNIIIKKKNTKSLFSSFMKLDLNVKRLKQGRIRLEVLGKLLKKVEKNRIQIGFNNIFWSTRKLIDQKNKNSNTTSNSKIEDNNTFNSNYNKLQKVSSLKSLPTFSNQIEQPCLNLSEEVKQALKKMQRFDRFVYAQNSQKCLTEPVEKQLRRIERIKNGRKQYRNIYFDNQLTITCLFNHVKLIGQLNREINGYANIKLQKQQIENKVIQMNVQLKKEMKQKQLKSKQINKYLEILISGLAQDAGDKGKRLIESHTRNLDGDKKILGNLILNLLNKINQKQSPVFSPTISTSDSNSSIYSTHLKNLSNDIPQLDRKLTYLEKQKNLFQNKSIQSQSPEIRETYQTLYSTYDLITKLYEQIKQKRDKQNSKLFISEKKLGIVENPIVLIDEVLLSSEFQKMAIKINDGEEWINELEMIKSKYHKKSLQLKNTQTKNLFTLINQLIKNVKDVKTLRDIVITKQQKLKDIQETSRKLDKQKEQEKGQQKQRTLSRIRSADKLVQQDPLKLQLIEVNKLSETVAFILEKKQVENKFQIIKLKKLFDNKKRYSDLIPIVTICERLSFIVIAKQEQQRKRLIQQNRSQQITKKQLNLLINLYQKYDNIIEPQKVANGLQLISKIKRSFQQLEIRISKILQNNFQDEWKQVFGWILSSQNKLFKLIQLMKQSNNNNQIVNNLPISPKNSNSISKEEFINLKQQLEQLRKKSKQQQALNYKLQLQIQKLKQKQNEKGQAYDIEERKRNKLQINKLNKQIQQHMRKQREYEQLIKVADNQIQQLKTQSLSLSNNQFNSQKQISQTKSDLKKKDQQMKQSQRQFKKRQDELNRCIKEKDVQLNNEIIKNQKLQGSVSDLIESIKVIKESNQNNQKKSQTEEHQQLLNELNRLKQQINVLNGTVDYNKNVNEQMIVSLSSKQQQQTQFFKEQVKQLNSQLKDIKQSNQTLSNQNIQTPNHSRHHQRSSKLLRQSDLMPNTQVRQMEKKMNILVDQNNSYVQTIQRLSQKIYEKQMENNQLLTAHYSQFSEIIESCKGCIKYVTVLEQEKQTLAPIRQTLNNIIMQISAYISQHQNNNFNNQNRQIKSFTPQNQRLAEFKKISQINYQQPDNIYLDEIQYFGNHHSISYITLQEQNKLLSRIEFLEKQRQYLYKRIKILSVFVSIDEPEKAFIHNLNCVIDRIFAFLLQCKDFKSLRLDYNYFMSFVEEISCNVNEENFINYFRAVEDFFKQLLEYVYVEGSAESRQREWKEQMQGRREYRGSTVKSQLSDQYQGRYQLSMHSDIRHQKGKYKPSALQSLLTEYLNSKNTKVLTKIEEVLNSSAHVGLHK